MQPIIANIPFVNMTLAILPIAVFVLYRLWLGRRDDRVIREHIAALGGQLVAKRWMPSFSLSPFQEPLGFSRRTYEVTYLDRHERMHDALARSSWLDGVILSEDRIVDYDKG